MRQIITKQKKIKKQLKNVHNFNIAQNIYLNIKTDNLSRFYKQTETRKRDYFTFKSQNVFSISTQSTIPEKNIIQINRDSEQTIFNCSARFFYAEIRV